METHHWPRTSAYLYVSYRTRTNQTQIGSNIPYCHLRFRLGLRQWYNSCRIYDHWQDTAERRIFCAVVVAGENLKSVLQQGPELNISRDRDPLLVKHLWRNSSEKLLILYQSLINQECTKLNLVLAYLTGQDQFRLVLRQGDISCRICGHLQETAGHILLYWPFGSTRKGIFIFRRTEPGKYSWIGRQLLNSLGIQASPTLNHNNPLKSALHREQDTSSKMYEI